MGDVSRRDRRTGPKSGGKGPGEPKRSCQAATEKHLGKGGGEITVGGSQDPGNGTEKPCQRDKTLTGRELPGGCRRNNDLAIDSMGVKIDLNGKQKRGACPLRRER